MLKHILNLLTGKTWLALMGAAVFLAIAYLPVLFAEQTPPQIDEEGKIKIEETKKEKEKREEIGELHDFKTVVAFGSDGLLLGSKAGLLIYKDGQLTMHSSYPGMDVKGVAVAADGTLFVAEKTGAWKFDGQQWKIIHNQEAHTITIASDDTIYLALKKQGIEKSKDGGETWEKVELPAVTQPTTSDPFTPGS